MNNKTRRIGEDDIYFPVVGNPEEIEKLAALLDDLCIKHFILNLKEDEK